MPMKFDEILKQRDKYHADNMETMSINDYRAFLETGAQIDALIEFLKGIRD